ncbi:MAG: sulfotransferase [Phormidesmis sp.]
MSEEKEFRPIFVVGNSRSGTTLMGTILGRHSSIFRFEELHFFEELWSATNDQAICSEQEATVLAARLFDIQRNGYLTKDDWHKFLEESKALVRSLPVPLSPAKTFQAFLEYEVQLQGKQRACDQTPQNVLYIKEILKHYPSAYIIHMVRDPRAILLSQKNRWKRPFLSESIPKKEAIRYWLNYHPITMSQLWKANVRTADQFIDDQRVYVLRYEDLLQNPATEVEKVCHFVGITYTANLLDVPQVNSSSQQDQPEQKGINKDRADSWKKGGLSKTELFWCQYINGTVMDSHSYETEAISPNLALLFASAAFFPVKLSLAILFSLKRMRNLAEAVKRRLD